LKPPDKELGGFRHHSENQVVTGSLQATKCFGPKKGWLYVRKFWAEKGREQSAKLRSQTKHRQ